MSWRYIIKPRVAPYLYSNDYKNWFEIEKPVADFVGKFLDEAAHMKAQEYVVSVLVDNLEVHYKRNPKYKGSLDD